MYEWIVQIFVLVSKFTSLQLLNSDTFIDLKKFVAKQQMGGGDSGHLAKGSNSSNMLTCFFNY